MKGSASDSPARVLVVGERRGLCDALRRLGVAFAVWNDPARRVKQAQFVHGAPLYDSQARAREEAHRILERHGPFSHVIAGTESAVLTAAVARRVLGARKSSHTTILRCRDKLLMKRHLADRGVPMTAFADAGLESSPRKLLADLGGKIVVKDRTSSGGRGLVVVEDEQALETARRRGRIAERFVDAPEVSVESFINHHQILFENVTEYVRKGQVNLVPGRLAGEARAAVLALNRKVIEGLRIDWGMTHAEMYLTENGPLFGEIALRPPGGYIMELLEMAWRFPVWEALVAVELDLPMTFPAVVRRTAAVSVLHPGAGRIGCIEGAEQVRADRRVSRLKLKVAVGDAIAARAGVGDDIGYVLFDGKDREDVLDAVQFVDRSLKIAVITDDG